MAAPRSLQARLTVAIASVLGLTLSAFSALLYSGVHSALYRHFDEQLAEDARAIANMVEERAEGAWRFEAGAAEYLGRRHGRMHFSARMDDGELIARSIDIDVSQLAPATARDDVPRSATLPGGEPARLMRTRLAPRQDEGAPGHPSGRRVRVEVARSAAGIEANLAAIRWLLAASLASTLLLASLAAVLAIRRGLAPIALVSARADTIDSARLDQRLPSTDLPHELRPAVFKLNELLARLQVAFERERQFTADAGHELRTPLAGLRSILEVSASRERSGAEHRVAIAQALKVVEQMHHLVEQLLLLARLDLPPREQSRQAIALRALLDHCFEPLAAVASARGLQLDNRIAAALRVAGDPEKLSLVFTNLLRNAVQYAEPNSTIVAESDPAIGYVLSLTNRSRPIPEHALEAVFERFVRLEDARSNDDGTHFGIGLALVRKLCDQLGMRVFARNVDDQHVRFIVSSTSFSSISHTS